jgi:AhpD family alkylhydroperoxidase
MLPATVVNRVPREDLPENLKTVWDDAQERHGDTTFVEVMGNSPDLLAWYKDEFYAKIFYGGRVPLRTVEMLRLRLANVHGCAFCVRNDTTAALAVGITQEEIDHLDEYETWSFSEADRAVLALADQMILTNAFGSLDQNLYARLKGSFTDAQIVELGMISAVLCGMAKFLFVYDLVERLDSCPFTPPVSQLS